jgi:hypothetical protein
MRAAAQANCDEAQVQAKAGLQMSYDELLEIVRKYWEDKSRTPEETKDDLENLVAEIDIMIEALE